MSQPADQSSAEAMTVQLTPQLPLPRIPSEQTLSIKPAVESVLQGLNRVRNNNKFKRLSDIRKLSSHASLYYDWPGVTSESNCDSLQSYLQSLCGSTTDKLQFDTVLALSLDAAIEDLDHDSMKADFGLALVMHFPNLCTFTGQELQPRHWFNTPAGERVIQRQCPTLPSLVSLDLFDCVLSTEYLDWLLRHVPNIRFLRLASCNLRDSHLRAISTLQHLEWLELNDNPLLTDTGIKHLQQCRRLRKLDLTGCKVSRKCVKPLSCLYDEGSLKCLLADVYCPEQASGLRHLQRVLPKLKIRDWDIDLDAFDMTLM